MPGPPVLNGPFTMPMFNGFVPRKIQPWIYVLFAFLFQLSGGMYGGALSNVMGDTCMMREDVLMIILCGVVGVNMPFPFLFRFKFRFTNRHLLLTSALVIASCDFLSMQTESIPVLCFLSYVCGFFKLCGTFECMSNIQLWMTKKRDFTIFFPLLYCIVLGNMSLSPWITIKLTYWFQSWHAMHWLMIGAMLMVALLTFALTHNFRFMKPLPLISLDWLGCILWSAIMIEIIFLFNYGEHYNWWDSRVWVNVACMLPVTTYFAVQRMCHIRHPFIAKEAWQYKKLVYLFSLFILVELISSTPKVLQGVLTGSVWHFGTQQTVRLYLLEWMGTICGCMFVLVWCRLLKRKFTKLLTLGFITLLAYEILMYFLVSPGVNIEKLYLPTLLRTFGVAIFFAALTIYLEEVMPFQHFFMGLTMAGLIRNGVVETVCSGIYGHYLRYGIKDNLVRGLPYEPIQSVMISVKYLFGATCLLGCIVLFVFLLWDIQPIRSTLRRMPYWNVVGRKIKKQYGV